MERQLEVNTTRSTNKALGKTFGWMAIALLVTFAVGIVGAFLLNSVMSLDVYLGLLIGASIIQFILIFVIQYTGMLSKKVGAIIVPFMLYSVCMGIILSSVIVLTEVKSIIVAFGATLACFSLMALVGYFSKSNLNVMWMIAMGLGLGAIVLSLTNWLIGYNDTLSWIVSFALFAFILLVTIVDVSRFKKVAESGQMTENLAIYFAFNIYYDFIMIFLRVLQFIVYASRKN